MKRDFVLVNLARSIETPPQGTGAQRAISLQHARRQVLANRLANTVLYWPSWFWRIHPYQGLSIVGGGEGGIRTHDTFPYTAFRERRHRPLGHLSVEPFRI